MTAPACRHCGRTLTGTMLDLGHAPPSNAYLDAEALSKPEVTFPLRVLICDGCFLVQTEDFTDSTALFADDYAYFSSTSTSWLAHAARYADMITERLGLTTDSLVVEVASNDGYLLRNFVEAGIPCLGIEPTTSTAARAEALGVPVLRAFFGTSLAEKIIDSNGRADLIVGNNVYAHVPDINDFTDGLARLLKPDGVVTLEFPHLMRLVEHSQFDTVYHEHFSYLSLTAVSRIFSRAGLRVFDVEELETHGGSLRIYGCVEAAVHAEHPNVRAVAEEEARRGMGDRQFYTGLQMRAERIKDDLLRFLLDAKRDGRTVVGYGAAAKGNTLLNFAGIKPDLLPYVCDAAPAKQGRFLPGSHIPILSPDILSEQTPDFVLILPWNIASEVREQLAHLAGRGTRFVTAVPQLTVH